MCCMLFYWKVARMKGFSLDSRIGSAYAALITNERVVAIHSMKY